MMVPSELTGEVSMGVISISSVLEKGPLYCPGQTRSIMIGGRQLQQWVDAILALLIIAAILCLFLIPPKARVSAVHSGSLHRRIRLQPQGLCEREIFSPVLRDVSPLAPGSGHYPGPD